MRKLHLLILVAALGACHRHPITPQAQQSAPALSSKEMMAAWEKAAKPGAQHKFLAQVVGNWDTKTSSWCSANSKPQISKGRAQYSLALGGRFLKQNYSGKMMGKPFNGFGLVGFDNVTKQYSSIWADSMGTGLMISSGSAGTQCNTIDFKGSYSDAASGKQVPVYSSIKIADKNHHSFEMYNVLPNGDKVKVLEVLYTRAKSK